MAKKVTGIPFRQEFLPEFLLENRNFMFWNSCKDMKTEPEFLLFSTSCCRILQQEFLLGNRNSCLETGIPEPAGIPAK